MSRNFAHQEALHAAVELGDDHVPRGGAAGIAADRLMQVDHRHDATADLGDAGDLRMHVGCPAQLWTRDDFPHLEHVDAKYLALVETE